MEGFAFGFVEALVGVGAEEVALGLEEVGGEAGGAVAVVVAEGGAEGGDGDAVGDGEGDGFAPMLDRMVMVSYKGHMSVLTIRISDEEKTLLAKRAKEAGFPRVLWFVS